jgi:hypothetical protein
MTDLPWDDEERMPALLRRIEGVAGQLLEDLERERRVWRSRQPALRHDPDTRLPAERGFDRVAENLRRVQYDARAALEAPAESQEAEPLDMEAVRREQQRVTGEAMLRMLREDAEQKRRRHEGLVESLRVRVQERPSEGPETVQVHVQGRRPDPERDR